MPKSKNSARLEEESMKERSGAVWPCRAAACAEDLPFATDVPSPLRRSLLVGGLAATAGLAACTSTQPADARRSVPTGQGAVLLRLVTDGVRRSIDSPVRLEFADRVRSAVVVREGIDQSSHKVRLMRLHGITQASVLMSGFADPGRYHVAWIEGNDAAHRLDPELLRFEVVAGTLTLLGTLVVEGVAKELNDVGHAPPDVEADKVSIAAVPALYPLGQAGRLLLPLAGPKLVTAQARARQFRERMLPPPIETQWETGEFATRGRLGRFFVRARGKTRAQAIDTGSWGELLSAQRYRGGLLVSGEEGQVRFLPQRGGRWEQLASPMSGLVRLVAPIRDGGLAALVRCGPTWSVHVTDDPWRSMWRKTAEFVFREFRDDEYQPPTMAVMVGDKVAVMQRTASMVVIEPLSGKMTRSTQEAQVSDLQVTQDAMLVIRARREGRHITLVSTDEGQAWAEPNLPRNLAAVAFRDRRTGYVIGVSPGEGGRTQFETLTTRDMGASWIRTGPIPVEVETIEHLEIDRVDGALLLQVRGDRLMRSADEGAKWTEDV